MRTAVVAVAVVCVACATVAPNQAPPPDLDVIHTTLTVHNVGAEQLEALQKELGDASGVKSVTMRQGAPDAVFDVEFEGCECDLPQALAEIPYPGLRFVSRESKWEYNAFDNQPPILTFVHPAEGMLINKKEFFITLEAPDKDLAEITVNNTVVQRYKGNLFRLPMSLPDGAHEIVAVAKDTSGNTTTAKVGVQVDTTPPALEAVVKMVVEGKTVPGATILIDGTEVPVSSDGSYRAEFEYRKGRKTLEIVAVDAMGNKTVEVKELQ